MSSASAKRFLIKILCFCLSLAICVPAFFGNASAASDSYSLVCGGLEIGFNKSSGKLNALKLNGIDYFSYASSQNGFRITDVKTGSVYDVSSAVTASYNKITQSFTNNSAGISLQVVYEVKNNGIFVDGTITDTKGTDRLITLEYLVPIKNDGMLWYDDIDNTRSITSGVYKYTNKPVNNQEMSVYPFAAVSDGSNTFAVGIPMDPPLASVMSYDYTSTRRAVVTRFNLGLSAKTTRIKSKADFSFVLYAPKEASWGMRAAAKEYYEMFPDYFETGVREGGNWLFQHDYSKLEAIEDFGFIVNETPNFALDEQNGIYSTPYTAPGEQFISYTSSSNSPQYSEYVNHLEGMVGSAEPDVDFPSLTKDFVASALKNSAFKSADGRYQIWGYKAYGSSFAFNTNNSPNLPSPSVFDLQMEKLNDAIAQAEAANVTVDGVYIDNWTGGWDYDFSTDHLPYTDYPLLWNSGKALGIPLMNTMYEYGKKIREMADQNGWIVIGNSVFPESKGAAKYVHLVDIAGSEVNESGVGGYTIADQRLRRMLVNQKPWANLLINDAGVSSSLEFKEELLKNSMVYGVFSNVLGYRVDTADWEACRHLFRKYTPIAKLTDRLGWQPVTYAGYKYDTSAVVERFGDFSDEALVLTMCNTGSSVLTSPVELDLTKFGISRFNYGRIMAFDLIKNEVVPISVNGGILSFERNLESDEATAVMLGSADRIFEYIGSLAVSDLKRISNAVRAIPREYNKYLEDIPKEWKEYLTASNNLLQYADDSIDELFKNGVAVKKSLLDAKVAVESFYSVSGVAKTSFRTNVLLPFERLLATFGGFFEEYSKIPNSFGLISKETLENSTPVWYEDFEQATDISDAVIHGSKVEFPWLGSMNHHSITSEDKINGDKSIRIDAPGGLITSTYLNNLSTVLGDGENYIFTMLLKSVKPLPDDFIYSIQGMTWQGSPNYFFTVHFGMENGILTAKEVVINDKSFYKEAEPKAVVKVLGDGLYCIAMRFTGEKASDGSESMFLRADVDGSAAGIVVDDYKLFSVSSEAEPIDFTPLYTPILQEDFENAYIFRDDGILGSPIKLYDNAECYYSFTAKSDEVVNGGRSLKYRSAISTELLHFGKGAFGVGHNYKLSLNLKDLYEFTDASVVSIVYKTDNRTLFEARFTYNPETGEFVPSNSSEYTAVAQKNEYGSYNLSLEFAGAENAYFTLKFSGKIKCSIDDIVIRECFEGESEERYVTRQWITANATSEIYSTPPTAFNPAYLEDFIPVWTSDFENASSIAAAAVAGTDVTFAWQGTENMHYICKGTEGVINGNRSLGVKHDGRSVLNSVTLTGTAKINSGRYYVSTFNIKFLTDIPDNFKFNIHGMTWDGSPNYFFTASLKSMNGELLTGVINTDSTIYPNTYLQPQCVVKEIGEKAYSVAIMYQGAKSSLGTEGMFLRTDINGDATEFCLDDFGLYVANSDTRLENMTSKALAVFSNGFETATAVGNNNITGATMFKALRHPLKGIKMNANFSLSDSSTAIGGEKSLVYENTEGSRLQNFAFGGSSASVVFKQSEYYITTFSFKSLNADSQSSITLHYRSGGYSPVEDDYLFAITLSYSENSGEWTVSDITKNSNVYFYSLPTACLQKTDGVYQLAVSFAGSKDRSGLEGTFISLEMNGSMKLLIDDFCVYQSGVSEDITRYTIKADETASIKGDINFDGGVNAADLILLRKHLLGIDKLTDSDVSDVADMDENGLLNIIDLVSLKKKVTKF